MGVDTHSSACSSCWSSSAVGPHRGARMADERRRPLCLQVDPNDAADQTNKQPQHVGISIQNLTSAGWMHDVMEI